MNPLASRITLILLLTISGQLTADGFAPFILSRLAAPKVELPAIPDDGSGIYRLNLDQALGKAPLTVVLEVQQGKVIQAVGLPVRTANVWCPTDGSQLKFESGRLTGTITIECPPAFIPNGPYSRTIKGKPNPDYVPYDLKPQGTGEITLDVKCEGSSGEGRFEAKWRRSTPKASPYSYRTAFSDEGTVSVLRQTLPASPDRYEIDLFLASALANSPLVAHLNKENPSIWLRLAMTKDRVTGASGFVNLTREPSEIRWIANSISYHDGKLSGEIQGALDLHDSGSFKLMLKGQTIGRRLFGTVRFQDSETDMTTQWIGHLHDSATWRLPLGLPTETWQWQHDRSPDDTLAEQAIRESEQPVMPGEPGKAGFWTWRSMVRLRNVSVIYPPSFDLKEAEGAAAYRFVVSVRKDTNAKPVQFEADKPWQPLAPIWKELPPGDYTLKVIAVDSQGKEMPGPMRMGILDKDTAKPSSQEIQPIQFTKRPTFAGPYAAPLRSWKEASLLLSRWHRQPMGAPVRHGSSISTTGNAYTTGGDHGYGTALANHIWSNLANRALTNDEWESALAVFTRVHWLQEYDDLTYRDICRMQYSFYRVSPDYTVLEFRPVPSRAKRKNPPRVVRVSLIDGRILEENEKLIELKTPVRPFVGPDRPPMNSKPWREGFQPSLDPVRTAGTYKIESAAEAWPIEEAPKLRPLDYGDVRLIQDGFKKADTPAWLPKHTGKKESPFLLFTDLELEKLYRFMPPSSIEEIRSSASRGKVASDKRFYGMFDGKIASWRLFTRNTGLRYL